MKLEGGIQTQASKDDLIAVLTNIESIKVKASYGSDMEEIRLRKIMLDIAIPQDTGFVANSVESCLCPQGMKHKLIIKCFTMFCCTSLSLI